jgi:hypothetical protein
MKAAEDPWNYRDRRREINDVIGQLRNCEVPWRVLDSIRSPSLDVIVTRYQVAVQATHERFVAELRRGRLMLRPEKRSLNAALRWKRGGTRFGSGGLRWTGRKRSFWAKCDHQAFTQESASRRGEAERELAPAAPSGLCGKLESDKDMPEQPPVGGLGGRRLEAAHSVPPQIRTCDRRSGTLTQSCRREVRITASVCCEEQSAVTAVESNPLAGLNHFTVPIATSLSLCRNSASVDTQQDPPA